MADNIKIPDFIRNFTALMRYSVKKIQIQQRRSECDKKNHGGLQKSFKTFVHLIKIKLIIDVMRSHLFFCN